MLDKILIVDDAEKLLAGLKHNFQNEFEIVCATSPSEALKLLKSEQNFAVIVSDYRMAEMNGVELLEQAKIIRPQTVRILYTAFAAVGVLTHAINEGSVFRLLSKPCSASQLRIALRGGVEQYRLIRAEQELLDKTLMGCVQVFGELISNFDPVLYAQVKSTRAIIQLLPKYGVNKGIWEAEIAVLLSHLGWLTVPLQLIEKMRSPQDLDFVERQILGDVSHSTCRLLSHIPRLETVTETILHEREPCLPDASSDTPRPWMILRACRDLVIFRARHISYSAALEKMESTVGIYHTACLRALRDAIVEITDMEVLPENGFFRTTIKDLSAGMTVIDPITTVDGLVIVPARHELHTADIERIRNFDRTFGLKESLRVQC